MAYQISPGVVTKEIDLTTSVPSVATTQGAVAGVFSWGPVEQAVLVSTEDQLVSNYGKPNSDNFETFFTAANFLGYSNSLYVSRAISNTAFNATCGNGTIANTVVKNSGDYLTKTFTANTYFVAKYPGLLGNSLKVSVCDSANAFSSNVFPTAAILSFSADFVTGNNRAIITIEASNSSLANTAMSQVNGAIIIGDVIKVGNTTTGFQDLKVLSFGGTTMNGNNASATVTFTSNFNLVSNVTMGSLPREWEYASVVDRAPGTSNFVSTRGGSGDEVHIVIEDAGGEFSGTPGTILEVFSNLSRVSDARGEQGGSIFYPNVLNNSSKYVWFASARSGVSITSTASSVTPVSTSPFTARMANGASGASETTISLANLSSSYNLFRSAEDIDISLVMTGKSVGGANGEGLANYLIDNVVEFRQDCVLFVSPPFASVVNVPGAETQNVVDFRNLLRSTSYAVLDSGYKYQYDRYNDVFRWVPLNGDIAGLCSRTDNQRDPWFSPAGLNRGQIKNVVKLAHNPNKTSRDLLYKNGINPVISIPGEGPVLYGDKTLLSRPSAFDRINVRRLFIVLRKAISRASKYSLFEFNDEFTRAQFRNLVEPFLRDVQGRRGIFEFRVVCDESNNTGEVIDRNEFIGDIYVKPAKSINFITLNFVATRTSVDFSEVVGSF